MTDLWEELKNSPLPILLYGMGNGADKIMEVCSRKGISVSGVFASDGFVRNKLFHGMPVTDYNTAMSTFGRSVVLLSFATARQEVLENIRRIARDCPLFVPDVPVAGEELFDRSFYNTHKEKFLLARSVLADERSRRVFDLVIESKLTGALPLFFQETTDPDTDFSELLHPESYQVTADLGAYNGDTALYLMAKAPGIKKIVAVEPDRKSYEKLKKNGENTPICPVFGGAWEKEEELSFTLNGNRGSGIGAKGKKTVPVPGIPVDLLFESLRADYLKYDVEGAELQALKGSMQTILRDKPELLVSCYHRPEDLFVLPLFIKEHFPFYRLYLRRHRGVPAWDINLYALPHRAPEEAGS